MGLDLERVGTETAENNPASTVPCDIPKSLGNKAS